MRSLSAAPLKNKKPKYWVPTLYFGEGLPFVATITVSVLMYKSLGLSDAHIALFTSLVGWPWALKPLWGPFLEMFKTKKHFVVATQFFTGVGFGLLALCLPFDGFIKYSLVLYTLIAFNAATHDIVADGVYINALSSRQQARYIGWQGAFYNLAKVLSQGALVYLAGILESTWGIKEAWMLVMGLFAAIMVLLALYHIRMLPGGGTQGHVSNLHEAYLTFADVVRTFFQKKNVLWATAFIILYRSAEGQLAKIVPLYLRASPESGGLGLDTASVGIAYGSYGAIAFVIGSLLGGYFTARRGLRRSLFILCCFFNLPDLVYVWLSLWSPDDFSIICAAIVIEYLGYGFGFVGVTLFMMQQIAPGPYPTAHYAFATSIMNLGLLIPGTMSGYISDYLGYQNFFIWVMIATIPSFLVAWYVPFVDHEDCAQPPPES